MLVAAAQDGGVGRALRSELRDLSRQDATLLHPVPLRPGCHVVLRVDPYRIVGRVTYCKCFRDGTAMLNIDFLKVIRVERSSRSAA